MKPGASALSPDKAGTVVDHGGTDNAAPYALGLPQLVKNSVICWATWSGCLLCTW
jgi:hypothetical protein